MEQFFNAAHRCVLSLGVCLLLCVSSWAQADEVTAQMEKIETHFAFTSRKKVLPVVRQYLIQRPNTLPLGDGGVGYTGWWLEFICQGEDMYDSNGGDRIGHRIEILAYDADDQLLVAFRIYRNRIQYMRNSERKRYYYALDLSQIPYLLLDEVAHFDLIAY